MDAMIVIFKRLLPVLLVLTLLLSGRMGAEASPEITDARATAAYWTQRNPQGDTVLLTGDIRTGFSVIQKKLRFSNKKPLWSQSLLQWPNSDSRRRFNGNIYFILIIFPYLKIQCYFIFLNCNLNNFVLIFIEYSRCVSCCIPFIPTSNAYYTFPIIGHIVHEPLQ